MRRPPSCVALLLLSAATARGQVGGNVSYAQGGGKARAEQADRGKRALGPQEIPPAGSMFVEANVLMNVKADAYVAVFGVSAEGETVEACSRAMDATVGAFTDALKPLGVRSGDLHVDFVAQNKIYGFEVSGNLAREKLMGFELKKNVSVHFRGRDDLDRLLVAAAAAKIYDLIKVDYVVTDLRRVHDRLMDEASRVIKRKVARYDELLGIKVRPPAQVYAERTATYAPTELYDSYAAFETEQVGAAATRQRLTVQSARKSRTFFFNGLDADGFDEVINPVLLEPMVQFTLYLKVKYDVEPAKAK